MSSDNNTVTSLPVSRPRGVMMVYIKFDMIISVISFKDLRETAFFYVNTIMELLPVYLPT